MANVDSVVTVYLVPRLDGSVGGRNGQLLVDQALVGEEFPARCWVRLSRVVSAKLCF